MDDNTGLLAPIGDFLNHLRNYTGGRFVFADFDALDDVRKGWALERDRINERKKAIQRAIDSAGLLAEDSATTKQIEAFQKSLLKLLDYNDALANYVDFYVDQLDAALAHYMTTEQNNRNRSTSLQAGI